jgi:dienelactone hydrolase
VDAGALVDVVLLRGRHAGAAVPVVRDLVEYVRDRGPLSRLRTSVDVDVVPALCGIFAARGLVRMRMMARLAVASIAFAATAVAAAPQYRTLNDRFDPPRFASRDAWEPRARYLREHVLASAGLLPMPARTPLNPVVFDEITHTDYTVSKVYFESLPGFFVTGNLYRPIGNGPFPAILSPHGHWTNGRLEHTPTNSGPGRAIGLARQGFVVFTHDMVGYNDSRQLPHTFGGRRENLWGLSLGGLQLWNGIRALDFLETLPYVRRDGFGVTGESGGGTQTFLLGAVDDRVAVAAPVNMISLHMQGGCLCENMPGLRVDTNNVEIAATIAPRPLLMVSATGDWTAETLEREFPSMRSAYALFGAESKVHAVRFDAEHNYNKDSREAMYAWMARWLQNAPADVKRPERSFTPDSLADLLVFYARPLPPSRVTADQLTEQWIASAKAQLASASPAVLQSALRHALGFGDLPPAVGSGGARQEASGISRKIAAGRIAVVADAPADVIAALQAARFDVRPVTFTPVDEAAAAKVRHFETYNRTPASQRVADIVAALRASPSAVLVADGDAALPALLAAAIVPVRTAIVNARGFDVASDSDFLERLYIPGLRRAGDVSTAAGMMRGETIVHDGRGRFSAGALRIERDALSAKQIVALASK